MEEENNEKKVIDIKPLSKWKRILIFLGDYFATFIISFILFNLAIFPLAKLICQTENKSLKAQEYEIAANKVLIDDGLIFKVSGDSPTLEENVNYTFKVFLSYYVFDEETSPDEKIPQYGHKAENEVLRNFYNKHLGGDEAYFVAFEKENTDNMFVVDKTALTITLKSDYKNLLANELLETPEDEYSNNMINVRDHVFARIFYINIYENYINKSDLVVNNVSYMDSLKSAKKIYDGLKWVATGSALVTILLSWGIMYLMYPLINGERRTLTMSAIKANKLHIKTFRPITRGMVAIQSFYHFVLCLSSGVFLPILYFGIAYCFNLPLLFIFMVISLGLSIVSLFFILFNEHNRSGSDILTQCVVIPMSEIDTIYREQNYGE